MIDLDEITTSHDISISTISTDTIESIVTTNIAITSNQYQNGM
jgi:hypothetical protein